MPKLSNDFKMFVQTVGNLETSNSYFTDKC